MCSLLRPQCCLLPKATEPHPVLSAHSVRIFSKHVAFAPGKSSTSIALFPARRRSALSFCVESNLLTATYRRMVACVGTCVWARACCHTIYLARRLSVPFGISWRISGGHTGGRSMSKFVFPPPSCCACLYVFARRARPCLPLVDQVL